MPPYRVRICDAGNTMVRYGEIKSLSPKDTAMHPRFLALPAWTFSVDMRDGDFIIDADGAEDPDFVATKTAGD